MQFTFISAGKAFTDPLLLLLTVGLITSVMTFVAVRGQRRARRLSALTTSVLLLIGVAAAPITPLVIYYFLLPAPEPEPFVPEYIVVPSGGYSGSVDPPIAVMTTETAARTAGGVEWWRRAPAAKLVFTGGDMTVEGTLPMSVGLMREDAIRRGVPASAIILESRSRNTREHGIELAAMLPRDARIGLITGGYHLPRATRVFRRHFIHVHGRSAGPPAWEVLTITHFIPSSLSIRATTFLLQEYVGMAWYALRS